MIFEGAVTTEKILNNFQAGTEFQFHTDADVTLAFWFPAKNGWGAEIPITAPGDFVGAGGNKGRITGTANVRIF